MSPMLCPVGAAEGVTGCEVLDLPGGSAMFVAGWVHGHLRQPDWVAWGADNLGQGYCMTHGGVCGPLSMVDVLPAADEYARRKWESLRDRADACDADGDNAGCDAALRRADVWVSVHWALLIGGRSIGVVYADPHWGDRL